jgi:hypothetical protein
MTRTWKTILLALCVSAASRAAQDQPPAPPPTQAAEPQLTPEGTTRVQYVPESVKQELREEIKKELVEQAKREGWAAPNQVPSWLSHFKPNADVRLRFERDIFGRGNANTGDFPDFNAINTNKPFDVNFVDPSNERYLNVDQNRTRPRVRARLGMDADSGSGFSGGVRLASGEAANPGSANQTLGNSGGDFSKYQIWLDRAFVRYDFVRQPGRLLALQAGRFDNPFFNTEMLWSPDVNFDGAVLLASQNATESLRLFFTAGAFPLYITPFAFPAERTDKFPSRNKWLYGGQGGAEFAFGGGGLKIAAGFYDFDKVEGQAGAPCDTNLSFVTCTGDDSRPSFAQKGNTYFALRTPSAAAQQLEAAGTVPRYQFFGLASRFREIVGTVRLDLPVAKTVMFGVELEYVHNAGFNKAQIATVALNNRGASSGADVLGPYDGGSEGTQMRVSFGSPTQERRWDWKGRVMYRYLQSDAVLDALNDQDFGLGGTNLKGYGFDFTLYVADGVYVMPRWFSANQIVGPAYAVDVLQIDLGARF